MNEDNLVKKQIYDDYKKVLSTEAGKRVFGGILILGEVNIPGLKNEYQQGFRDFAVTISNTIRAIDPVLVAKCEIAYNNFIKSFSSNED